MSQSEASHAKAALRADMLARRRALEPETRGAHAQRACERVLEEPTFLAARSVCAYMPLPQEMDIATVIERTWMLGKQLVLPRVRHDTHDLDLHRVERADVLEASAFRVREPRADAPRVVPDSLDLILVPGLAFDPEGYRLGFGKGFYDRLLPLAPQACWLGVGFDFQFVAQVPHEVHDVPLHRFVSEARSVPCADPRHP